MCVWGGGNGEEQGGLKRAEEFQRHGLGNICITYFPHHCDKNISQNLKKKILIWLTIQVIVTVAGNEPWREPVTVRRGERATGACHSSQPDLC